MASGERQVKTVLPLARYPPLATRHYEVSRIDQPRLTAGHLPRHDGEMGMHDASRRELEEVAARASGTDHPAEVTGIDRAEGPRARVGPDPRQDAQRPQDDQGGLFEVGQRAVSPQPVHL